MDGGIQWSKRADSQWGFTFLLVRVIQISYNQTVLSNQLNPALVPFLYRKLYALINLKL